MGGRTVEPGESQREPAYQGEPVISPVPLSRSPAPVSWSRSADDEDVDGEQDRASEAAPERVGPYRVGPRIGRGGMGRVHEATHVESGDLVALKLPKEGASARACARLLREARTARAAAGEHVVEVLDAGLDGSGRPFVAMERLSGEDLGAVLRREGRLDVDDALALTLELLLGLERVHGAGVVHRDLKPENIVVLAEREGAPAAPGTRAPRRIKIVDFGVSKARTAGVLVPGSLTRDGVVLGTPLYMSPEQAQGLPDVDERSDLWSVGAILFQCLTGRAPHAGATYEQIVVAVCSTDAPDVRTWNPAVTEPVARVLQRALARDRARRFQDARSMRDALLRASDGDLDAASHDLGTATAEPIASSRAGRTLPLPLVRLRRRVTRRAQLGVALASVAVGAALTVGALSALDRAALDRDGGGVALEGRADALASQPIPSTRLSAEPAPLAPAPPDPPPTAVPTILPAAPPPTPRSAPKRGVAASLPLKER